MKEDESFYDTANNDNGNSYWPADDENWPSEEELNVLFQIIDEATRKKENDLANDLTNEFSAYTTSYDTIEACMYISEEENEDDEKDMIQEDFNLNIKQELESLPETGRFFNKNGQITNDFKENIETPRIQPKEEIEPIYGHFKENQKQEFETSAIQSNEETCFIENGDLNPKSETLVIQPKEEPIFDDTEKLCDDFKENLKQEYETSELLQGQFLKDITLLRAYSESPIVLKPKIRILAAENNYTKKDIIGELWYRKKTDNISIIM